MVVINENIIINTTQEAFDIVKGQFPYAVKFDESKHNIADMFIIDSYYEKGAEDKDFSAYLLSPRLIYDTQSLLLLSPLIKFRLLANCIRHSASPFQLTYLDLLNDANLQTLKGRFSGEHKVKCITYNGGDTDSVKIDTIDNLMVDTSLHSSTLFKKAVFSNGTDISFLAEDTTDKTIEVFRGIHVNTPLSPSVEKDLIVYSSNDLYNEGLINLIDYALPFISAFYEITYYVDEDMVVKICDITFKFKPEYITSSLVKEPIFAAYIESHMIGITMEEV
jgi:hypothetical protein